MILSSKWIASEATGASIGPFQGCKDVVRTFFLKFHYKYPRISCLPRYNLLSFDSFKLYSASFDASRTGINNKKTGKSTSVSNLFWENASHRNPPTTPQLSGVIDIALRAWMNCYLMEIVLGRVNTFSGHCLVTFPGNGPFNLKRDMPWTLYT